MSNSYKTITSAIISLMACFSMATAQNQVSIKASLDSVSIIMGRQTALRYEIVQPANAIGHFAPLDNPREIAHNVEIIGQPLADTTDLGNGRIQIDRALIIQSFDSGVWEIPGIRYVIGSDTFRSNDLNLKVIPVNVDSMATVHDYKFVEEPPRVFSDYVPDVVYNYWWILLVAIILAAGGYFVWRRLKKGKPIIPVRKKEVPPYEEAIDSLRHLKEEKLWQNGMEKEYFTKLTDILRRYIERRFFINAIEMTSSQIIETLKANDETRAVKEQLQQILDVADFVKFANVRPLPSDSEAAWNRAMNFVEETKPVPTVEDDKDTGNKDDNNKKETDKKL